MTQVERIKAEIERLQKCYKNDIQALEKECYTNNVCANWLKLNAQTKIDVCRQILSFINSQQAEPVSEESEEAAKHYLYSNILYDDVYVGNPTEKDCIEMFKAGTKWQKEQMLKAAVEGTLSSTITGSEQTVWAYAGYGEYGKDGDKVKLIIIEED